MTDERDIYIVDGHSQVFKAYHGIKSLSTSKGLPTNATYGFIQILHRLIKTRNPQYLAVVFDSSGPTFRHEIYTDYKANRSAPPEDLSLQMESINRILNAMRLPVLKLPGYEADDIIATMTKCATEKGYRVWIVTADKDLFQLVSDNVKVIRLEPNSETVFDREAVKTKMGVFPEQIVDYLAMVGDSSDNVPGIKGIGAKSASALLEQWNTLDGVYNHISELKGKQKENLESGKDSGLLSRELVTLDYNVPLDCNPDLCKAAEPDSAALIELYREHEFKKLAEEVAEAAPAHEIAPPVKRHTDYKCVTTLEDLKNFIAQVSSETALALDVETDGLNPLAAGLVGICLSIKPNEGIYIPVAHVNELGMELDQIPLDKIKEHLNPIFADPSIAKIAHNLKFDWHILRRHGFHLKGNKFDTLLASYIINSDRRVHGLKELAHDLLNITMVPITDLIGTGKNQMLFSEVALEEATQYGAADADVTVQLHDHLAPKLKETGLSKLFEEIEMPLVEVLMNVERNGVTIDTAHFARLKDDMNDNLERIRAEIYKVCGKEFNIGSPKQVAQVLFEELKLRTVKKKKTGYSTDIEVLEELSNDHEAPRLLAEYRQFEKLKSTYVDVLPTLINSRTGRIHTCYNQAIAATGRLSSTDPNLQNIPIRSDWGKKIREGFIPSDPLNNVLLSCDYSQIELRVLAHVTGDPALVTAYTEEQDIHALTASKVYNVSQELVTDEMRSVAKMVNFGVIYGMSAQGLSSRLKIPYATAKVFIEEYFKAYQGVKNWLETTLEIAREVGYVETVSGRRRYLPDINSKNFNVRSGAERIAVNAPIQGTSADMIKIAMINIDKRLSEENYKTKMILQVHDELIFDVPEEELQQVQKMVVTEMLNALPLRVPIKVGIGTGKNWAEC